MSTQHQIWSIPPDDDSLRLWGCYHVTRWQWAVKMVRYLEENGHTEVEIRLVEREDTEGENDEP